MAKLLYMVIRKADMQVVQLGALESACAKQFLEDPEALVDTSPVSSGASYSCYSKEQLTQLAINCGITDTNQSLVELTKAISASLVARYKEQGALESEEFYEAKIAKRRKLEPELYAKFEPEEPVLNTKSYSSSQTNRPKSTTPATRPAGGTTKLVWDIADAIRAENPAAEAKILRPTIIAKCEAEGINASTAGTQFAKWKNSQSWGTV